MSAAVAISGACSSIFCIARHQALQRHDEMPFEWHPHSESRPCCAAAGLRPAREIQPGAGLSRLLAAGLIFTPRHQSQDPAASNPLEKPARPVYEG